jgi:excisionase family DNA binding protein
MVFTNISALSLKIKGVRMEIKENEVYTTLEAQQLLKVSPSTTMRLIKKGIIRTAKIGKQYRIMGKELLRLLSPKLEDKVGRVYNKGRRWVHKDIDL